MHDALDGIGTLIRSHRCACGTVTAYNQWVLDQMIVPRLDCCGCGKAIPVQRRPVFRLQEAMSLHGLGDYMPDSSLWARYTMPDSDVVEVDACDGTGATVLVTSIPRTLEDLVIDGDGRPDLWLQAARDALAEGRVTWAELTRSTLLTEELHQWGILNAKTLLSWDQR